MSQAEYIFSGTIGDNVLLGRPGYRFNINELLEKLHLGKLQFQGATRLSDVAVKDAGHEFSGGERQRILFARAIWASADLYLFDEPTTGLDPVAKSAVIDEIRNLAQRSPVVFVTHDPDLLEIAGEVLFMNRGRVSEHGDAMSLISDKRSCTSQMFAGGLKNVARGCPDTETSQAAEVLS